jgi:hypothetical protein
MSRGLGRIERAIRELLDAHPDLAFVTDDLVRHCYPRITTIERKHQVSVLRAMWNVIGNDQDWTARRSNGQGGGWVVFNRGNLQGYGLGRMIASRSPNWDRLSRGYFYSKGFRVCVPIAEGDAIPENAEALVVRSQSYGTTYYYAYFRDDIGSPVRRVSASLTRLHSACHKFREYITAPTGDWLRDVQIHCAKRDGFLELAATLQARKDAAWLAGFNRFRNPAGGGTETLKEKCYEETGAGTSETLNSTLGPVALAARIRDLAAQNDPDVLRAGLATVAAELDGDGREDRP